MAQETGISRENLYKSPPADGNPEFATVFKVVSVLGLRPQITAASEDQSEAQLKSPFLRQLRKHPEIGPH